MPRYEYRCPNCQLDFDRIIPIDGRHEVTCTRCGTKATLKISLSWYRLAQPFHVFDADGNVLYERPDSEPTEPPTPPEKAHWLKGHANLVEV